MRSLRYSEYTKEQRSRYGKNKVEFRKIFEVALRTFWQGLFGFDAVKFDEHFFGSDNPEDMLDCVEEEYSKEARVLIERLMMNDVRIKDEWNQDIA